MPDPPDQPIRSVKRRRIGRFHSSTESVLDDCHVLFRDQANNDRTTSATALQQSEKLNELAHGKHQQEKAPVKHGSLKECMDSIMAELREARENLLEWMRGEIQAICTATEANNRPQAHTKPMEEKATDESKVSLSGSQSQSLAGGSKDDATAQPLQNLAGGSYDGFHIGSVVQRSEQQNGTTAEVGHVSNGSGTSSPRRGTTDSRLEIKNRTSDVMAEDDSVEKVENDLNAMDKEENLQARKDNINDCPVLIKDKGNGLSCSKVVAPRKIFQNNNSSRKQKEENKHTNTIYGPAEGFSFKINHDIEKRSDERPEGINFSLRSPDRESNGDKDEGLACSLSNTSSSKENLGLSKAYNVGSYGSFSSSYETVYEEQMKAEPGLGSRFVTAHLDGFNNRVNVDGFNSRVNVDGFNSRVNEFPNALNLVSKEAKDTQFDNAKGMKLNVESKISGSINGASDVSYRVQDNKNLAGGHMSVPTSQDRDPQFSVQTGGIQHHLVTDSIFGCGTKRNHETAMSFNGFSLDKEDDVSKGNEKLFLSDSFAPKCNPNAAKLIENIGLHPNSDKAKFRFWNENNMAAPASLLSIPLSRNAMNPMLDGTHLNQTYHNKIGDIASTGRTGHFTGFDPHFNYPSQVQTENGMLDVYQSRPSSIPVYFPNSEFLPLNGPSQFPPVSMHNPSVSSSSMLLGMTGVTTVNQDPSNAHTFLGLGMNAQPTTMNQVQELSGLYNHGNVYHSQPFKQASLSRPLAVSNQKGSGQVRSSLELKF